MTEDQLYLQIQNDLETLRSAHFSNDPRWHAWRKALYDWIGYTDSFSPSVQLVHRLVERGMNPDEIWAVYALIWK